MIIRNWVYARAEYLGSDSEDGNISYDGDWIAETRARTGTWVLREWDGKLTAAMFPWSPTFEGGPMLLTMTPEQRAEMGMSDETYTSLNVRLCLSIKDETVLGTDEKLREAVENLRYRVSHLEACLEEGSFRSPPNR